MNNQQHLFNGEVKIWVDFLCSSNEYCQEWYLPDHNPRDCMPYYRCSEFFRFLNGGSLWMTEGIPLQCVDDHAAAALFVLQNYLTENLIEERFADGADVLLEKVQDNAAMRVALLETRKQFLRWLQQNVKDVNNTHSRYILRNIKEQIEEPYLDGTKVFP